jgi:uncharacterized membrane protein
MVLTVGVALGAAGFLVAVAGQVLGARAHPGALTDLGAVADGLASLDPWAWATLGTFIVVLTPVAGLVATAIEYAVAEDRGTLTLALVVLAILIGSAVVAILR